MRYTRNIRNMRKKADVPFDVVPVVCELHPGLRCDTAKGKFIDANDQELRGINGEKVHLAPAKIRLLLVLVREQLNSPRNLGYSEMDELIIAKYPKDDFPSTQEEYEKAERAVKADMSFIRKQIEKVHGEDIIDYGEGRNAYRIKPAQLCDRVKSKK